MGALIAKDPFKIDFLYYMLNAINDLSRERNGSIIPHIYFKDYGQNIYNLPSIPEQSKISSLFTYLIPSRVVCFFFFFFFSSFNNPSSA